MNPQLQGALNALVKAMQGANISSPKKKGRKRGKRSRKGGQASVVAPAMQNPNVQSTSGTRRRKKRGMSTVDGQMRVSRDELLASVSVPAQKASIAGIENLTPKSFSWLSNVARSFERCVFHSAQVYWRPAVGTNTDGMICYGVDWNWSAGTPTRETVVAKTPAFDHAVWQDTRKQPMILPASKLASRKEYLLDSAQTQDTGPGQIVYAAQSTVMDKEKFLGELWIRYDITLFGTKS